MVNDNDQRRDDMITQQLVKRGIRDTRVLQAMQQTPRHLFVPAQFRAMAYDDMPLPIGHDQTISQPLMVALMMEALRLRGDERVLEIGTGSGYQAAVLSRLAMVVFSIERLPALATQARAALHTLGAMNVHVLIGDGSVGLPAHGPFDAIIVAAAAPKIPEPLVEQLKGGGRLVIPVGDRYEQTLVRLIKTDTGPQVEHLGKCRFVPLLGEEGWLSDEAPTTEAP
jgi:protein-L-isoaspartate(D-aspartate) O-methyltransferase